MQQAAKRRKKFYSELCSQVSDEAIHKVIWGLRPPHSNGENREQIVVEEIIWSYCDWEDGFLHQIMLCFGLPQQFIQLFPGDIEEINLHFQAKPIDLQPN